MVDHEEQMQDVTDGTGRQVLDDIFEESRMLRTDLDCDVDPPRLTAMDLPADPYIGFYRGRIRIGVEEHDGETLVVASAEQRRRYLLKRWNGGKAFKAYQATPQEGEKLRLLNVYRVMVGQPVNAAS